MAVIEKSTKFPAVLERELFNKVAGHSTLARLSRSEPVAVVGKDIFTFDFDGEVSLVGEGENKPASDGTVSVVSMQPVLVEYTMRVSNQFLTASEEQRIEMLRAFTEGYAKKLARGLDIMAMHGLDPQSKTAAASLNGRNFDGIVTNLVEYDATAADVNISDAIAAAEANDAEVTGIAISPAMRGNLAALTSSLGAKYPEFAWGGVPEKLGKSTLDANSTVSVHATAAETDHAIVGDFANAFRYGIAKDIPLEIIPYGDPDGRGDLKRKNQIALRAETYIAWAIMDADRFAIVQTVTEPEPGT